MFSGNADSVRLKTESLRSQDFRRILLVKPSALGDVVHTIPLLPKLRLRFPRAQIDWFITPENAELVKYHPALSGVVLFDRDWPQLESICRPGLRWMSIDCSNSIRCNNSVH